MRNAHTNLLLAATLLPVQKGTAQNPDANAKLPFTAPVAHTGAAPAERSDALTLWTENFESGLNGWTVETPYGDVGWGLTSTGNTEGFTPGPLEGTSGYPGGQWVVVDSDADGTAGAPENMHITSPPILGYGALPFMMLRFEQSFRQLNDDQTLVKVSGNGGATWFTYPVNQDVAGKQSTPGGPNAQVVSLNISDALAEGSDDIRLRFEWISDQSFTYSWQVDEVSVLAAETNDLALLALAGEEHASGTGYYGIPCTVYPVGETHKLGFMGDVINNGGTAQTNVRMRLEVSGPDGYAITLTSASVNLAPAAVDSLFLTDIELPDVIGDYHFVFSVIQDEPEDNEVDNTVERWVRVDAQHFARDMGQLAGTRDNEGLDYESGNRFWILGYGRMLQGVDVALGPGTEVGALINAMVYEGSTDVGSSDLYAVTPADINGYGGSNFVNLPLLEPLELESERLYLVSILLQTDYGNAFIGISGTSEPQASLIRPYNTETWYYTTSTPMVRMRLVGMVGMADEQHPNFGLHAFPTPFDEQAIVTFNGGSADGTRWELRDATGRLALTGNTGILPPGEHRILLDGGALESGMYTMTLETGGVRSTVKLVRQARR